MRGPGSSTYSDEVQAADEVADVLAALASAGIKFKLGHIPDRNRLRDGLTISQIDVLKRRKLDILRVLLAREMVAEAEQIRRRWVMPDHRTHANGRRYGDLLFSARAILPPGVDWDDVTYESVEGKVCWSHQLAFDRNGKTIEGIRYDNTEAELLLEECKGGDRGSDEDHALAS